VERGAAGDSLHRQFHYDAYKKMVQARAARARASAAQQQDNEAYLTGETAEPNRIIVQEFDGFGPLPDNHAGNNQAEFAAVAHKSMQVF